MKKGSSVNLGARFLKHTMRETSTGCWLWTGSRQKNGYASMKVQGKTRIAHRVAYEHFVGRIPDGLHIDHRCRRRHCVNPSHLEPVTNRENLVRGATLVAKKLAQTQCVNGHPFDERNTRYSGTHRQCRACDATRHRAKRAMYGAPKLKPE